MNWATILGSIIATWPPIIAGFVINTRRTRQHVDTATQQQNQVIAELTEQQDERIAEITRQQTETLLQGTDPAP